MNELELPMPCCFSSAIVSVLIDVSSVSRPYFTEEVYIVSVREDVPTGTGILQLTVCPSPR